MKFRALTIYDDMVVDPQVDEEKENIDIAIGYEDHGDNFIFVKTKSGESYIYGWFCNRPGWPDQSDLERTDMFDKDFIRKPIGFKKDDRFATSNKILFRIKNDFHKNDNWGFSDQIKVEFDKFHAQLWFDSFCGWLKEENATGGMYHLDRYKFEVNKYLELNDILTDENLKKLDETPFNSRVNGLDGIAGKIDASNWKAITFDTIKFVFKNERFIKKSKVKTHREFYDDFGFPTYSINLSQFN